MMFGYPNITGTFSIAAPGQGLSGYDAFYSIDYSWGGTGGIGDGPSYVSSGVGVVYPHFSAQSSNAVYTDNGSLLPRSLIFNCYIKH